MDWSGFEVDLTLRAPNLYLIRTAAEEEQSAEESVRDARPISDSSGSTANSLAIKQCISHRI